MIAGAGLRRRLSASRGGSQPRSNSESALLLAGESAAASIPASNRVRTLDAEALHAVMPPVRSRKFWIVQGLVIVIFLLHQLAAGRLGMATFGPMAHLAMVSLFLFPILYAALNFGFVGSVATAAFMTVLMGIDLAFDLNNLPRLVMWEHVLLVSVLDIVSVVVGQRVEAERRARHRAEVAMVARASAEDRYRSLFEFGSAPVLVLDHRGVVEEANGAALDRFGDPGNVVGRDLASLVGKEAARRVLRGDRVMVTVAARDGAEVLLRPRTTMLASGASGRRVLQVVFQDVTEEVRRHQRAEAYALSVIEAQEDERRRIAAEIHDEPLQTLIHLIRQLDSAGSAVRGALGEPQEVMSKLAESRTTAERIIGDLREIMKGLRPPALDDLGLSASVRQLVSDFKSRSAIGAEFFEVGTNVRLAPSAELAMFRIAQESLTNVVRHSGAHSVTVRLIFGAFQVRLEVEDDGCGFEPPVLGAGRAVGAGDHLGIVGMSERASLVGGQLEIRSVPGKGSTLAVVVPTASASTRAESVRLARSAQR